MINLEEDLFNPIFDFLIEKKEYFEFFDKIAHNKKKFTDYHGPIQYKNEKWLQAELAVFLTKSNWIVATEVNTFDLCATQESNPNDEILIEMKVFVNSGRNPKTKNDGEYSKIKDDIRKIRKDGGLALILLPKCSDHDIKVDYSKYVYQKIKKDFPKINELYSRSILYNGEKEKGFWVSWWSFEYKPTKYQELAKELS